MLEDEVVEASVLCESRPFYGDHEEIHVRCLSHQLREFHLDTKPCWKPSTHSNVEPRELGNDTNYGCSTWTYTLVGAILPSSRELTVLEITVSGHYHVFHHRL